MFKNGLSKLSGRQPLKNLKGLPQVLLGPFLNTLSQTAHSTKWYEHTSLTR